MSPPNEDRLALRIDGGNLVVSRQSNDLFAEAEEERIGRDEQGTGVALN
jgi:hypothetical protein